MKKITLLFMLLVVHWCYPQLPMEDFEGNWAPIPAAAGLSTDWLVLDNGIGINYTWDQEEHVTGVTPSYEDTDGTHAAFLQLENVTNGFMAIDYLITPEFVVQDESQLIFWSRLTKPGDNGGIYKIKILPSATLDASDIEDYEDLHIWASELDLNPLQLVYQEKTIPLPAEYVGATVRLAFVMEGDNMDRWLIDQVKVVQECEDPSNLSASDITLTTAQLNWQNNSGATNWEIEIIAEGSVPTGHGIEYNADLPYTATTTATGNPLTQQPFVMDSHYRFYVRSLCDDTGVSEWIGPFDFKLLGIGDNCDSPMEITSLPFSDTNNTANFANEYLGQVGIAGCETGPNTWPFFSGNEVVYNFTADFTGNIVIDLLDNEPQAGVYIYNECSDIGISCLDAANSGQVGGPITISDFPVTAGQDYYIIITSSNVFTPTTPYTLTIQQQSCEEPDGLPVSNITTTTATFSWTNPAMASSWELQVQEVGAGVPIGAGEYTVATSMGYEVDDLNPATNYEYYVRTDCGDGTFSSWAGPYAFNTLVCEGESQCLYTFVMKDMYADGWVGQTINVSQNGILLGVLEGPPIGIASLPVQISVCDDMPLEVFWNEGPEAYEYATEIGLEILNSAEQLIYDMPIPPMGTGFQGMTLYNGTIDCDTVLCMPPIGLEATNATMNSIDLTWNGPATGNWEYYITVSGQEAPDNATTGAITTINPVLNVPLDAPATNYDVYVRMLCVDGTFTTWAGPVTFGSAICPQEDKCNYVFTMGSQLDWGWFGGYMTVMQNGIIVANIGQSYVYGPPQSVTVPLCNNIPFEIYWTAEGDAGGGPGIGSIYALDVYNSFGQNVFTMPYGSQSSLGTTIYSSVNDCDEPVCIAPVGLYAENIATTTADIGWEGIATGNWEYYIVDEGQSGPVDTTPGTPTTSNPTINVPLTAATNYEFYVRLVCENTPEGYSEWAGPFAFNTEICEEEDKCLYNFEMFTGFPYSGYNNHTMTISQNGNPVATIGPEFTNGPSMTVQVPLCPDSDIEIFWNDELYAYYDELIGLTVYDPYYEMVYNKEPGESIPGTLLHNGEVTCDPPGCLRPLNPTVTDVSIASATLQWEEMGDAEQWMVWALPLGSPEPVPGEGGIVVTENPYTIEDLEPSTPYVWYVMAMCGDQGNSTISFPGEFRTLISNDECIQAIPVPVNPGIECIESVSGTVVGGSFSNILLNDAIYCGYPPGYPDVWYSFVAENSTHVIDRSIYSSYTALVVFKNDCENLEQIYCNSAASIAVLDNLTVGETYYIMVTQTGSNPDLSLFDFDLCVLTPVAPVISINEDATHQELIEQTLFGAACGTISNIAMVSGSDFGYENSIGSFNQNGSTFPMQEGMIIATGGIDHAMGPNPGSHMHVTSDAWPGDIELTAIFPNLTNLPSSNASVVEFDFVPSSCHIGFDFIFASDIYSTQSSWQCESNNGFAILLTGPMSEADPTTTNLAVLPETDTPIGVGTIRPPLFYNDCEPLNEEYFGVMNDVDPINSPISYNGQTVVMQASSQVIQGETYHLKIVIEDKDVHSIGCHDSALFIKGHECEDIVDFGPDLLEENGTAICYGSTAVLDTTLDSDIFDFRWFKDDIELIGETSGSLTVTGEGILGEGVYTVIANYEGSDCTVTDSIEIEIYDPIQFNIQNVFICQGTSGTVTVSPLNFDPADAAYSWTLDGQALLDNTSSITVDTAGVYEVIVTLNDCDTTAEATVVGLPLPVIDTPDNVQACESYTLPELSPDNTYYTQTGGAGTELAAGEVITSSQTIFVLAQTGTTPVCTAETSFDINIMPFPQFDLGGPYIICAEEQTEIAVSNTNFDLEAASYSWAINGEPVAETASSIMVTDFGTYSVSVTVGNCPTVTQSVEVQENSIAVTVLIHDFCEDNVFMLQVVDDDGSFNPDTAAYSWTGPGGFTTSTQQFEVPEKGIYKVVVTTPEGCVGIGETDILSTSCFIQRGISPNTDGSNDFFDLENMDVARLSIFNRYGIQVYTKSNYKVEWYGQANNGDELPTGTYYYTIERRNGEQITGWIYINRENN